MWPNCDHFQVPTIHTFWVTNWSKICLAQLAIANHFNCHNVNFLDCTVLEMPKL